MIAIATCRARRHQADAQRRTWAAGLANVHFFVGGDGPAEREDEVVLPVDDSYAGLPAKVKAIMAWALERGHDSVLKLDDDVYLVPSRLPRYEGFDYVGNFRMRNGNFPSDYCSGFCYLVSRQSMEVIASAPLTDNMEDRWVGNTLDAARPQLRLRFCEEKRFGCTYPGIDEPKFLWGSTVGKTFIAIAQYPAKEFGALHYWYRRAFPHEACQHTVQTCHV